MRYVQPRNNVQVGKTIVQTEADTTLSVNALRGSTDGRSLYKKKSARYEKNNTKIHVLRKTTRRN